VVFLLVDGEEAGLLGAQAFVDEHRWAKHIGVAVNLDAGGTRGVTSITRTSPGNALMLDAFADVAVPYGASVIGAVYGLTPYDTDFSVYNRAEIRSIDLGFGEDKAHYHTPLDRLGNLDPASVQHLGDTALALVRRLADADLDAAPDGERVFLDALGLAMIAWPAPWTAGLALLAVLLMAFATWRLRHVFGDIIERAPSPDLATPAAADGKVGRLAVGPATAKVALRRRLLAVLALPLLIAVPAAAASGLAWLLAWLTGAEAPRPRAAMAGAPGGVVDAAARQRPRGGLAARAPRTGAPEPRAVVAAHAAGRAARAGCASRERRRAAAGPARRRDHRLVFKTCA
jgi:hypothetical protein